MHLCFDALMRICINVSLIFYNKKNDNETINTESWMKSIELRICEVRFNEC